MSTAVPTTSSNLELAVRIATRVSNPAGSFDKAGRWYPTTPCACCGTIRNPSRAFPYSYLVHCRTINHLAAEYGVDAKELRRAVKAAKAN